MQIIKIKIIKLKIMMILGMTKDQKLKKIIKIYQFEHNKKS